MIDPRSGRRVDGRMISSLGRIKSKAGRISLGSSREDGYLFTQIKVAGSKFQRRTEYVHRLVAASFLGLPPSPEHSQVNHKDLNKSNNTVENLEYVTPAENVAHHFACLKGCQPSSKAVLSRAYGSKEEWTHHPSQAHAAETLGLHQTAVSKCARGLQNQTGGYEFRFAEPEPCVVEILPGEEWRDVDVDAHLKDREGRNRRQRQRRHMKVQGRWAAELHSWCDLCVDLLVWCRYGSCFPSELFWQLVGPKPGRHSWKTSLSFFLHQKVECRGIGQHVWIQMHFLVLCVQSASVSYLQHPSEYLDDNGRETSWAHQLSLFLDLSEAPALG